MQTEKPRRTLIETFTVIYALEKWELIKAGQVELWRCDILCDTKKHEPYLDKAYEELQNFNFVQSDEEKK